MSSGCCDSSNCLQEALVTVLLQSCTHKILIYVRDDRSCFKYSGLGSLTAGRLEMARKLYMGAFLHADDQIIPRRPRPHPCRQP